MNKFRIDTRGTVDLSLILRGIFSTAVVFWHTLGAYHVDTIPGWLNVPGRVSVWVFFGLSGYVIGHGFFEARYSWVGKGLAVYFLRRAARILPLFWLVTLCAIVLASVLGSQLPVNAETIFSSALAAQWSHTTYLVGVFWTLGVEIQFYVLAPVVALVIVKSARFWPLVVFAAWIGLWANLSGDNRTMIGNLQHFLVGMAVARGVTSGVFDRLLAIPLIAPITATLGLIFVGVASDLYHGLTFWGGAGALWTDAAIFSLLLCHCAIERAGTPANTVTTGLMVLGVLAYGIYAWHGLLLTFAPSLTSYFLVVFVASLVMACLSFVALERPVIDMARTQPRPPEDPLRRSI